MGKIPPKPSPDALPPSPTVQVVFEKGEIIIGGRVLQVDEDPIDLMERYFEEGPPHA